MSDKSGRSLHPGTAEFQPQAGPKDSYRTFARGIVFGIGGAILGLILYSAASIITGLEIAYVSLAAGYTVGRAITFGSRGNGGRCYQIAALLLTYGAVSLSAVPIGFSQFLKQRNALDTMQSSQPALSAAEATQVSSQDSKSKMTVGGALTFLVLFGLASPFLGLSEPIQGLLGLVIVFVAMRIAWRLTASENGQSPHAS